MESAQAPIKLLATSDYRIVAMTEFKGQIIVATERGVYRLENDEFVPLKFKAIE